MGLFRIGLQLHRPGRSRVSAADDYGGSWLAAPGSALQLRRAQDRFSVDRYNFSIGEKLSLEFTPMLGAVFGETKGIAPGYKYTLGWWKLELYSEGEYVFDAENSSDRFFYTWSELSLAPVEWFRFGLVIQRTKLYQTEFDIQRGLLIGFSHKDLGFTTCVFNLDDKPTVVLGVSVDF